MEKIIHYCWFGNKTFPKSAQKCLKSWEKFLPDYKIIKWSEENVNLNECEFIRWAYENKKWAFVADYVRAKVLKEYGGIYFDTDMELIKDIKPLIDEKIIDSFLGAEYTGWIAAGIWFERNKNAILPTKLLEKYFSIKRIDVNKINDIIITKLISDIANNYGFKSDLEEVQYLEKNIVIFPREYFYPYSVDWIEKIITSNTYAIHYYRASWLPLADRVKMYIYRLFGKKMGDKVIIFIKYIINFFK